MEAHIKKGISIVNNGRAVQVRFNEEQLLIDEDAYRVYQVITAYWQDEKYARRIRGGYSFRPGDNFESLEALEREFQAVLSIVNQNTVLF